MKKVKIAYALQSFQELLSRVALGDSVMICRYNTPVAVLSGPPSETRLLRKFGTLKGKAEMVDPRCFTPTNDADADALIEGRF